MILGGGGWSETCDLARDALRPRRSHLIGAADAHPHPRASPGAHDERRQGHRLGRDLDAPILLRLPAQAGAPHTITGAQDAERALPLGSERLR